MINPLDLRGPEFLQLYLLLLVAAVCAAATLRWTLRLPADGPVGEEVQLDPYEVAYLAGGEQRAADAAIVGLVQRRVLAVAPAERKLIAQSPLPAKAHPLEKAVAPSKAQPEWTVVAARSAARPALAEIRDRLIGLGLVVADGQAWATRLVSSAPFLAVLALGILKFIVGMTRHRPVGFLFWLCALSYGIAVILLCVRPHRSRYGDRVLDRMRRENEALGTATESRADELTGADLALAWALFGTAIPCPCSTMIFGVPVDPEVAIAFAGEGMRSGTASDE